MSQTSEVTIDTGTNSCNDHLGNISEFYCQQHQVLGCSECIRLEHKDCTVNCISEIAFDFINGAECRELNERIDKLRREIKEKKKIVVENLQKANKNYLDNVEEVKSFRKEIEEYVARMEQTLLSDCQKRKEEGEELMKDIERECNSAEDELVSLQVEHLPEERAVELFVQAKAAEKRLTELEKCMKEIDIKNRVDIHQLKRRPVISEMMAKEIPVGEIHKVVNRVGELAVNGGKRAFDNLHLERIGQIFVRLPTDKRNCWITGMTCLKDDRLACADYSNKSVKIVDVKKGAVTNQITFESSPRDVAAIYNYQIAVTMEQENKIEILMQDGLTKSYDIKVDGTCSGIAHKDRLLYVSYIDPPKVEVLYLEGQVWQRYTKDNFGVHMFRTPRYLDVTKDDNYENYVTVSDWRTNYIRKIKLDVRKHRDTDNMNGSNGVVVLPDESLLVCGENHRVYHISSDLTRSRVVLKDIDDNIAHPDAICFNAENDTFFLSNRLPGYHSDNIFMYKLKKP